MDSTLCPMQLQCELAELTQFTGAYSSEYQPTDDPQVTGSTIPYITSASDLQSLETALGRYYSKFNDSMTRSRIIGLARSPGGILPGQAPTSLGLQAMAADQFRWRMKPRSDTDPLNSTMGWIIQEWIKLLEQREQTPQDYLNRLRGVRDILLSNPSWLREAKELFAIQDPDTAIPESDLDLIVGRIPDRRPPHGLTQSEIDRDDENNDRPHEELDDEDEIIAALRRQKQDFEANAYGCSTPPPTITPEILAEMRSQPLR